MLTPVQTQAFMAAIILAGKDISPATATKYARDIIENINEQEAERSELSPF